MLAKPRVLLLDEAEANLDAQARACLAEAIAAFKGTVVFISHDSDRARAADRMLRVADGQVTPVKPEDNTDNGRRLGAAPGRLTREGKAS